MGDSRYRRLFRLFSGRRDVRRELDEELDTHVALRAAELERAGMDPERAREEAARRLGDRRALHASARLRESKVRRAQRLDALRGDLLLAVRRAGRAPGATALTLLTLLLGIGLTTTGFSVVDHVLFRPLPFADPDRLVALLSVDSAGGEFPLMAATPWRQLDGANRTLEASALHAPTELTVQLADAAFRAPAQEVTGDFFRVFRSPMRLGRTFERAEVESGEAVVVVSERFWRTALGSADPLHASLLLNGVAHRLTGVVAAGYGWPADTDLWIGTSPAGQFSPNAYIAINWMVVGRLAPGATLAAARADLSAIARTIREENPSAMYSHGTGVIPLRELLVGDTRLHLALLAGAVGLLLALACANVAGLGLARGVARTDELRVRLALGAGRPRLVRQLLTEQIALAAVGGALGVLLAWWATRLVAIHAAGTIPRAESITLDGRVLAFALIVTPIVGILAGALPALRASASSLGSTATGARGRVRGGRTLPGAALVAAEIALAMMLLAGTGLLLRSFAAMLSRDLGFDPRGVVTASLRLDPVRYASPERRILFWEELRTRASTLPGVASASLTNHGPGTEGGGTFVEIFGRPDERNRGADYRVISDGYLAELGVPLVAGRWFDESDRAGSPRVVLVNQAFAESMWPGESAVGKRMRAPSMELPMGAPWLTVVGVVGNLRHYGFETPMEPEIYVLYRQVPYWSERMTLVARAHTGTDAGLLVQSLRSEMRALDRSLAADFALLEGTLDGLVSERRFVLAVLAGFAALALTLAAVGLYGLISFSVASQIREIGVRAALGARRSGILTLMMMRALRVAVLGTLAGFVAAFWLARTIESLLIDVPARDPASFAGAGIALLLVALLAAAVPAARASRVDPLVALRAE